MRTAKQETRRINGDGTFRFFGDTYQAHNWLIDVEQHREGRRKRGYRGDALGHIGIGVTEDQQVFLRDSKTGEKWADAKKVENVGPKWSGIQLNPLELENPNPAFLATIGQMVVQALHEKPFVMVRVQKDGSTT